MRALAEIVRRNTTPLLWLGSAIAVAMALGAHRLDAHKAVTSRYTYNEHIFPILRDKCGRGRVDAGNARVRGDATVVRGSDRTCRQEFALAQPAGTGHPRDVGRGRNAAR